MALHDFELLYITKNIARSLSLDNVTKNVAYSGSGGFLTPESGMGKKSRAGSGFEMNIPDNTSGSLETIFWVQNT
jgi:hypothetical protein